MKRSLALALALIMVMGCMSFAAAEGRTVTADADALKALRHKRASALAETFLKQMKALGLDRTETEELLRQTAGEE